MSILYLKVTEERVYTLMVVFYRNLLQINEIHGRLALYACLFQFPLPPTPFFKVVEFAVTAERIHTLS